MLQQFEKLNSSLSQDLMEEVKTIYQSEQSGSVKTFELLPSMLRQLKIEIPQLMLKQLAKYANICPSPYISFKAFTHFVARATLEDQLEEEIKNLFYHLDKNQCGTVDGQDLIKFLAQLDGGDRMKQQDIWLCLNNASSILFSLQSRYHQD